MPRSLEEIIELRVAVAAQLGNEDANDMRAVDALNRVDVAHKVGTILLAYYHRVTKTTVADLLADLDAQIDAAQQVVDNANSTNTETIDGAEVEEVLASVPPTEEEIPVYVPVENGKRRLSRSGWFGPKD